MPWRAVLMAFGLVPLGTGKKDPFVQVRAARETLDRVTTASQKQALNAIEIQAYSGQKADLKESIKKTDGAVSVVRDMLKGMDNRR